MVVGKILNCRSILCVGVFMQNKNKCKCGSLDVIFFVQKGRSKKLQAFCEKCLPVEPIDSDDDLDAEIMDKDKKPVLNT